ncbi:hypothetical protein HALLA_04825 [Halostagnicola larsenii XH-48]|uniref:HVO-0234-like beta-propeller domain-containing protein n=1 Tax=Halostagnicola larsenii XH-48 TaxID=797299 RepID=W0JM00_9EURY|nr:hypothetical protein [Halostagnicola larsenii]AHF98296.1 hypothetical protein HALLA_04825 [Halostagnicola larsenii XH-48]
MSTIDEKRVYGESGGALDAYVGSSMGLVHVRVSDSAVGEFSLCHRRETRDLAAGPGSISIATDEDVLVADPTDPDSFAETEFGPATAVSYDGETLLAAGPDGRVARRDGDDGRDADDWETLADSLEADVRAMDGDLLGTERGVYRVHDGALDHAGLSDVHDVSAAGVPLAATESGLYKLGNGWMEIRSDPTETVATDPASEPGHLERAHAVSSGAVYEYAAGGDEAGEWVRDEELAIAGGSDDSGGPAASSDPIVGFGYGETVYAVSSDGTVFAADGDGWRPHVLGVTGVTGIAVPATGSPDGA